MTWADKITIAVGAVLVIAWLILFALTVHDRRYVPKHRRTRERPHHRYTRKDLIRDGFYL